MIVIFVLLLFTVTQFMLSQILSGQESELTSLHRQVSELAELLGLEKEKSRDLTREVGNLSQIILNLTNEKEMLSSEIIDLERRSDADRKTIEQQLMTLASLNEDIDALRKVRDALEKQVGTLSTMLDDKDREIGGLRDRSKALEARIAEDAERTLLAQKQLEERDIRIQALSAVVGEQKSAIEEERQLSADARAEVALLNRQIAGLRNQLEAISRALKLAEETTQGQEEQIEELGRRLNIALARQVGELERYRSEFFGRLKAILGENPLVRIEGDRFVLQAELLFASGSATLGREGRAHLKELAVALLPLSRRIPDEIQWILRIDGHTDPIPIRNAAFSSNWELSTARAVSVVEYLASEGVPEERMAAAGFSRFHPVDPAHTAEAYRKNRRIEIKLTSR
jgi:chemotaxis protein MotB